MPKANRAGFFDQRRLKRGYARNFRQRRGGIRRARGAPGRTRGAQARQRGNTQHRRATGDCLLLVAALRTLFWGGILGGASWLAGSGDRREPTCHAGSRSGTFAGKRHSSQAVGGRSGTAFTTATAK